jgi:hypothetical protein
MALVPPVSGRNFMDASNYYSEGAIQARSVMRPEQKTEYDAPSKTIGGAVGAGVGYAGAGASFGAMTGATAAGAAGALGLGLAAWGGIGLGVGLGMYLLS